MAMTLITTNTSSNAASSSFTSSIDSTYKLYIFKFYDVNPVTDAADFSFQLSTDGGSSYGVTMTTTFFYAYHFESTAEGLTYRAASDLAQSTSYQPFATSTANAADGSCAGELYLFNPSNTTYVKHFYATVAGMFSGSGDFGEENDYMAGYANTTSAIDAIDFKMDSGNMDSVIKMYGVG